MMERLARGHRNATWRWGLVLLPLAYLAGCQLGQPQGVTREGQTYGVTRGSFRHVWYGYHERGRSFAEGRFWREAEADFRLAIARRRDDAPLARTYGMHFISYYPNRELGIALLGQGRLDEALAALEASNRTAPSARGQYWLDESRRQQLARDGVDASAPRVAGVDIPERTREARLPVRIEATDDTFVKRVRVQGRELPIALAARELVLDATLELSDGANTISIEAEDLAGKTTTTTVTVQLDRTGPALGLEWSRGKDNSLTLRGQAIDPSAEVTLAINGTNIILERDEDGVYPFEHVVTDTARGIAVIARDGLGNETLATVDPLRFAGGWPVGAPLAATVGGAAVAAIEVAFRNFSDRQQVFQDMVIVDLEIRALRPVAALAIAGAEIPVPAHRAVYLSQRVHLTPGMNEIRVDVTDAGGLKETRTLTLERMETGAWGLESRATLAIAPFRASGALAEQAPLLRQTLSAEILRDRRFREVARDPEEWRALMAGLPEANPGAERASGVRFARLVKADYLLFVDLVPSHDGVETLGRLIDVHSGRLVATPQIYGQPDADLRTRMTDMAYQLRQAVPLISGTVASAAGDRLTVNRGERARLESGQTLHLFRPRPHEADALMLGTARVGPVGPDTAIAIPEKGHGAIRAEDAFITR